MNFPTTWWAAKMAAQLTIGQTPDPADPVQVQSVWDLLLKGGPMMIPIGLCSLAAVAVIAERLLTLRRRNVIPGGFVEGLRPLLDGTPVGRDRALTYCRDHQSPIARIFIAGLRKLDAPEEQRTRRIYEAGERELFDLRKYLRLLSVVATLAPVLGLLGTVFGMIKAFQTVATSSEALGKTELLARGIYEALITTAAGLVLAIPVLVAYHWLSSRIDRLVHEMDQITVDFFSTDDGPVIAPTTTTIETLAAPPAGGGSLPESKAVAAAPA